jgi:hypothetical protein
VRESLISYCWITFGCKAWTHWKFEEITNLSKGSSNKQPTNKRTNVFIRVTSNLFGVVQFFKNDDVQQKEFLQYHSKQLWHKFILFYFIDFFQKKFIMLNNSKFIVRFKPWPSPTLYKFMRTIRPRR